MKRRKKTMTNDENKERFLDIYKALITRDGAEDLLNFLDSEFSDFFKAPASTRFHGSYAGGLLEHSLHVYDRLKVILNDDFREMTGCDPTDETIALVALLHDICKVNVYKTSVRNKKVNGTWIQVPYYEFDDSLPFGHGEKSVFMISEYMKLSREEAFAIRYHMGFSGTENASNVGKSFEMYPLAFALHMADGEATYYLDTTPDWQ